MNNSIQQEIAAPKVCKKNLWLTTIFLVNLVLIIVFMTLTVLRNKGSTGTQFFTMPFFLGLTIVLAIFAAIVLRKHHLFTMTVLTLAAIDCAILLLYQNAVDTKGSSIFVWRMLAISVSFAVIIFTLVFLGVYYSKPRERKKGSLNSTKFLTYTAMFTALSIICKILGNSITAALPVTAAVNLKLSFVYIPWVIGGIALGPIGGFAAAIIADILGQLAVSTGGMPLPGIALANGLFAVFPALIYKLYKRDDVAERALFSIVVGTVLSTLICTLGISAYTLYTTIYTGDKAFFFYMLSNRLPQTVIIAINIMLMIFLSPALIRAKVIKKPISFIFD